VSPLDDAVVTSRFGEGNNSFVSLRADSEGAAVRAVRAGVVISVASGGVNVGHMVAVRHDATLTTVYTNLQPPVVAVGDGQRRDRWSATSAAAPSSRPTCCASTCVAPTRPARRCSSTRRRCSACDKAVIALGRYNP
jgi:hypothetical protein